MNLGGAVNSTLPAVHSLDARRNITIAFVSAHRTLVTSLRISAGEKAPVVSINDARGRLVKHNLGQKNGTSGAYVWDGTDMNSRKVCTGTYFVTCVADAARVSARLAVSW